MLSQRFVGKYMRMAKQLGEDDNPCHSRKIGVVLVNPLVNKVVGTGYNGPPKSTPHCDSFDYLKEFVWPQLTVQEQEVALKRSATHYGKWDAFVFAQHYHDCQVCPRRLVGAPSGARTELCSCEHAERNAIYNASCSLDGCYAFCWCCLPCQDCTKALINAGITKVFCLDDGQPDYSWGSRWLFQKGGVELVTAKPETYLCGS